MMYHSEKLALLIDGHELSTLSYSLGFKIDYRKLRMRFASSSRMMATKYYAAVDPHKLENPYIKLLDWLEYNGYRVHRKNIYVSEEEGGTSKVKVKGSVAVDISVDLVQLASQVDHIVLAGGHADYSYPITQAQRLGARVTLLGSLKAEGFRPADDLRRIADDFIELDDLRDEIVIADPLRTAAE